MSGRQVIGATIFCRDCGYALDGLRTHECPECGRAFDPADPSSFYIKNMPGPNARWWLKQPGWLFFASIALPIGLALWLYRIPYYYYEVGYWSFLSLLWLWAWLIYAPVLLIRA